MAITSYTTLVTACEEWLARTGDTTLNSRVPDFITLAEAKFNRLLYFPQMEKRSYTTVTTSSSEPEFITLPSDFQTMRRIRLSSVSGKPKLDFMTGTQADEYRYSIGNASSQPKYFTIFGTEIELIPTPDSNYTIEMVYRAKISGITSSNTSNWLLTLAPDLYLYGCLMEAAPYIKDDERIAIWASGMHNALDQLNQLGKKQAFNSGPLEIRSSGPTP